MIQIDDKDMPIEVAQKLILGTKVITFTPMERSVKKALTGEDSKEDEVDMFDLNEIKEIADYLMVYYNSHRECADYDLCSLTKESGDEE